MIHKAIFFNCEVKRKTGETSHTNLKSIYFSDIKCNNNPIEYCEKLAFSLNVGCYRISSLFPKIQFNIFNPENIKKYYVWENWLSSSEYYIYS